MYFFDFGKNWGAGTGRGEVSKKTYSNEVAIFSEICYNSNRRQHYSTEVGYEEKIFDNGAVRRAVVRGVQRA